MAYSSKGKILTQHALMDEIVYHTKLILHGLILKNCTKANNAETKRSLDDGELFLSIINGVARVRNLPITKHWLLYHGFSNSNKFNEIRRYLNGYQYLPMYVSCTFIPYDKNIPNTKEYKVSWNPKLARFEYPDGRIAGINKNRPVFYNRQLKKFQDSRTNKILPDDAIIIGFKEPYYVDSSNRITFHDEKNDTYTNYSGDRVYNPVECMPGILREYANDYYHEEQNNYYRTLMGLPEYGTHKYDIVWNNKMVQRYSSELGQSNMEFPLNVPIHEFTNKQIKTLEALGILDDIKYNYRENATFRARTVIQSHPSGNEYVSDTIPNNWKYLDYLGSKRIDLYLARSAKDWDILYIPKCENLVQQRFKELYKTNRDIYFNQTFDLAYQYRSDYYEEMLMFMTVCQTFSDMVTDTPEWYIRRDIFDLRSVKYFLDSNSVAFYEDIPLRYQVLIVKNLNKLIKYKSTDRSIYDILSLFSAEEAKVYKFYIFKKYLYTLGETESAEDVEDFTGWTLLKGWIKNGDFETGDITKWNITMDGKQGSPAIDYPYGYKVERNEYSTKNTTYRLDAWNNGDDQIDFNLYQKVENLPLGTYKVKFRLSGAANGLTGIRLYADNNALINFETTHGTEKWRDQVSESFELSSSQDVIFRFEGMIPPNGEILLDDIELYGYDENYDCGDEEDPNVSFANADEFFFRDENKDPEDTSGKIFIYDFGDENSSDIRSPEISDSQYEYNEVKKIISDEVGNVYDLEFVKVPIGDTYDNYIKDEINREPYDLITRQDKYWDGEDTHYYVRNCHLNKKFTIEGTKYMALQYEVDLAEYNYEKAYFLGMIFTNNVNTDSVSIPVPSIEEDTYFNLKDLFIFIYCLNGLYNNTDININLRDDWKDRDEDKPEYEPFFVLDGGRPWDLDEQIPDQPKENHEFETPDLDFGDMDKPRYPTEFVYDQNTKYYDFGDEYGYGPTIVDPSEELDVYEYADKFEETFDPKVIEEEIEKSKKELWPMPAEMDFYDEETENFVYNPLTTATLDCGDIDLGNEPETYPPYLYDFYAESASMVRYIGSTVGYKDKDSYPGYYIENPPYYTVYMFYEYKTDTDDINNTVGFYEKKYDWSQEPVIEDDVFPWPYDLEVNITIYNYKQYLGCYIVDPKTGKLILLTEDNYIQYLGKQYIIYSWHDITPNRFTIYADGHHLMRDEKFRDLEYDYKTETYKRVDGTEVVGDPVANHEDWRNNYDGGWIKYNYGPPSEMHYDWLRSEYPYLWVNLNGRILGFNSDITKEELANDIGMRHSYFGWSRGFTLEDCGCENYAFNKKNFESTEEMQTVYEQNTKCYKALIKKIENADTRDQKQVLFYVYHKLFTIPFDESFYRLKDGTIATSYDQLLKQSDFILYNKYLELKAEKNNEARHRLVRDLLNDLVDTLSYYIHNDILKYALSFIATNSPDAIIHYISLLINFFKSWKVYFLDPGITFYVNDKANNTAIFGDNVEEIKNSEWVVDNAKIRDAIDIKPKYIVEESADTYNPNQKAEVIDLYAHYENHNIFRDKIYDGEGVEAPVSGSRTDENGITTLDGGEVSVSAHTPFYSEDGGRVAGRIDVYHLDCGGVGFLSATQSKYCKDNNIVPINLPNPEMSDSCIYIDGGDLDEYFDITDDTYTDKYTEDEMELYLSRFNIVDGGTPNNREVYTKTAITHLSDYNEVSVDARLYGILDNNNIDVKSDDDFDFGDMEKPKYPSEFNYDLNTVYYDFGDMETSDNSGPEYVLDFMDDDIDLKKMTNGLSIDESGIIFNEGILAKKVDTDNLMNNIEALYRTTGIKIKDYHDILFALADINKVTTLINNLYADYFKVALQIIAAFANRGEYSLSIANNVDRRVEELDRWFDEEVDPFPDFEYTGEVLDFGDMDKPKYASEFAIDKNTKYYDFGDLDISDDADTNYIYDCEIDSQAVSAG